MLAGQPSTCCGRRESRRSRAPRPHALLQTDFLFAAARPGLLPGPGNRRRPRVSRGLPRPLGPASCTPNPAPGLRSRWTQLPGTRGRCAAVGAEHERGPPAPPGWRSAFLSPGPREAARKSGSWTLIQFSLFSRRAPSSTEPLAEGVNWREFNATLFPKYDSGCPEKHGPFAYSEPAQQPALLHLAVRGPPAISAGRHPGWK